MTLLPDLEVRLQLNNAWGAVLGCLAYFGTGLCILLSPAATAFVGAKVYYIVGWGGVLLMGPLGLVALRRILLGEPLVRVTNHDITFTTFWGRRSTLQNSAIEKVLALRHNNESWVLITTNPESTLTPEQSRASAANQSLFGIPAPLSMRDTLAETDAPTIAPMLSECLGCPVEYRGFTQAAAQ